MVNDAHGHAAEEFVIVLPETSYDGAMILAERVREAVAACEVEYDGVVINLTASFGVAEWYPDEPTIESALKRSDRGVYATKAAGRNRVVGVLARS